MKYIIVIGDGMADNPVPALGGKTPLETAQKPVIDSLAQKGELGTVLTVPRGLAPGSDTAILSIFGYDPRQYYSGRSPLEAAGVGVLLKEGEVSYRCNMVALSDEEAAYDDKHILSHSGGSIEGEEAVELMESLLADPEFAALCKRHNLRFTVCPSFRHIAVQSGVDVSGLAATPPHDHLGEACGPLLPKGGVAAEGLEAIQRRSFELLDAHPVNAHRRAQGKCPANSLWFWAQGSGIRLPSFVEAHKANGFVVSAVPLVQGIGRLAGLSVVEVPGATGELDTNFEAKADAVAKGLADGADFALLHVEAPDECTHNGDLPGKVQAIEWLDSRSVARLVRALEDSGEDFRLLILSDHKTLTATRGHDGDPVPYILYDSRTKQGGGLAYTEQNAQNGPYVAEGSTLIDRLFEE